MLLLIAKSSAQIRELRAEGWHIGRLLGPRDRKPDVDGMPWAADNDAFSGFDQERYVRMLEAIAGVPGCLFVSAPDVVGDWRATLNLYDDYGWQIHDVGQPAAYVLQDGQPVDMVPWDTCEAVFIGGSTEWKLGPEPYELAQAARARGKHVHLGRCNTMRRVRYAHRIGAQSIDGTKWSLFMDAWKHQLPAIAQGVLE